ncbi:MAG: hypothetical protein COC01_01775 [Bacteroidetes bacterium]|nr:MAG: hypothetical protein COC01_01775 [Bacteroidota bacterium]
MYFDIFTSSFHDYWNYVINEVLNPSLTNYFYWLIGISLFFFLWEIILPWRKLQHRIRKDFWLDCFYMFFNFFLFSLIGYHAISTVFVQLFSDFLQVFGIENLVAVNVAQLPKWSQLLTLFILRDFIQWNIHRLLHKIPILWNFHKIHHSVEQLGFAAHLRFHWMETVVYRTLEYIPLAMIGFGLEDFFIVHITALVIGHFNHSNIILPLGPLKYIFNNPQMHYWHHSHTKYWPQKYGINFGLSLSLWDYLFKTNHIPDNDGKVELGFENLDEFPKSFWSQVVYPFKK